MMKIESYTFNVDAVIMAGIQTNEDLAGMWNRIPWRVWLHEPSNTLQPSQWILELGGHRYPLRQSSRWEQNEETKSWEQLKSSWKIRTADGRWVP
jgi:hypothetical protein